MYEPSPYPGIKRRRSNEESPAQAQPYSLAATKSFQIIHLRASWLLLLLLPLCL